MEKEKALERLTSLENEAKQLRKIIESGDSDKPITERVKSKHDVFRIAGLTQEDVLPYKDPVNKRQAYLNACAFLDLMNEVMNEGWVPDYTNSNQPKWNLWFDNYTPGSGFSSTDFVYWYTRTGVGSRFCFKTKELGTHAWEYFKDEFNKFLIK